MVGDETLEPSLTTFRADREWQNGDYFGASFEYDESGVCEFEFIVILVEIIKIFAA